MMKLLTNEQKKFYDENGYVVLDIFTTEEMNELSDEYNWIFDSKGQKNLEATWQGDWNKEPTKMEVKSIHNLQMYSGMYTRLLTHNKLLDACEDVMETENILLHHTKAHLKPPGTGSKFPMHQDYHYFPFEKDSMVALMLSIDDSEIDNGCLCVYPGSHKLGPQEDVGSTSGWHYVSQEKFPLEKAIPLPLKRGQLIIFSYLLIHGSYQNMSNRVRRMFLMQFMSADDTPLAAVHVSDCQRMVLRGKCLSRDADIKKRHADSKYESSGY